ncbi:hypothetical protein L208DRAFT_1374345 [Tricholoma matsutake]|nr:hypothetical protein L208DRAFT_1374345 [Tricholoma matsutake 945]
MAYACQYWCYHLASLLAITGGQTYIRSRKQLLKGFLGKIACQWLRHWLYNLKGRRGAIVQGDKNNQEAGKHFEEIMYRMNSANILELTSWWVSTYQNIMNKVDQHVLIYLHGIADALLALLSLSIVGPVIPQDDVSSSIEIQQSAQLIQWWLCYPSELLALLSLSIVGPVIHQCCSPQGCWLCYLSASESTADSVLASLSLSIIVDPVIPQHCWFCYSSALLALLSLSVVGPVIPQCNLIQSWPCYPSGCSSIEIQQSIADPVLALLSLSVVGPAIPQGDWENVNVDISVDYPGFSSNLFSAVPSAASTLLSLFFIPKKDQSNPVKIMQNVIDGLIT